MPNYKYQTITLLGIHILVITVELQATGVQMLCRYINEKIDTQNTMTEFLH